MHKKHLWRVGAISIAPTQTWATWVEAFVKHLKGNRRKLVLFDTISWKWKSGASQLTRIFSADIIHRPETPFFWVVIADSFLPIWGFNLVLHSYFPDKLINLFILAHLLLGWYNSNARVKSIFSHHPYEALPQKLILVQADFWVFTIFNFQIQPVFSFHSSSRKFLKNFPDFWPINIEFQSMQVKTFFFIRAPTNGVMHFSY